LSEKLEELGIGRPSTYAPTSTIINRNYVEKGNLDAMKELYTTNTQANKIGEKLKENTGSDKENWFLQIWNNSY
jgi:DNA topoisomerase-1